MDSKSNSELLIHGTESPANIARAAADRHRSGDLATAITLYKKALALDAKNPGVHYGLGIALAQSGQQDGALSALRTAAQLTDGDARVLADLGKVALAAGALDEARKAFEATLLQNPNNGEVLTNLGSLYRDQGLLDEAAQLFERAVKVLNHPKPAMALGGVLRHQGKAAEALSAYRRALAAQPNLTAAAIQVASCETELGQFDAAASTLRDALNQRPGHPRALAALLSLRTDTATPDELSQAETIVDDPRLQEPDQVRLSFAIARARDRRGDWDAAFTAAKRANDAVAKTAPFDAAAAEAEVDRLEAVFTRDLVTDLAAHGSPSTKPVLIVGLPRTGTTLAEQVLASHPQGEGAGELPDLARIPAHLTAGGFGTYPELLKQEAISGALKDAAVGYLEALATATSGDPARVVDKFPFNFSHLGLFAALFPNGTIIHCHRDPRDVFISCYMTEFTDSLQAFRARQDSFARYYALYGRLVSHWEKVLPGRIHHLPYEGMVADFDQHAKGLVDACGLPWDEACARFHETERPVRTPSRWQVRQPIYKGSVGRWKTYTDHLKPLITLLEEGPTFTWGGADEEHP